MRLDNPAIDHQILRIGGDMSRFAVAFALLLGACTVVEAGGGRRSQLYLGATTVAFPQTEGAVHAIDIRILGLGWDDGPFLGWRSVSRVTADPTACHLLIIIRSAAETANALRVIDALRGQDPCIVDYTNTLRR
jgi:hypothetical protein